MARIRTIKPEFFTSEDIVSMTPLARIFYVSLWCEADREGRMEWKPKTFKMRYLPGDNCEVVELAQELIDRGLIVLYAAGGKQYAEIPTFAKHQVINNRESESVLPPRVHDACLTRESGDQAEGKEGKEGKGKEGNGFGDAKRRTRLPADFYPDETGITAFAVTGLSLAVELEKFRNHHKAKGSVMLDWQAAWRTWAGNAAQFQPAKTRQSAQAQTIEALTGGLASAKGSHALALT
jgi:hypothetical protein